MRQNIISGHNVDKINIPSGLRELSTIGYNDPRTIMVIEYALIMN